MNLAWGRAPYEHQQRAAAFAAPKDAYALLMEQGTGKTAVAIHDAAARFAGGEILGLLVLAPSGVHTNWVLNELPKHMPPEVRYRAAAYYSAPRKAEREALTQMNYASADEMRVLTMNWEALTTAEGVRWARDFCKSLECRAFIAGDESQRVKSPKAVRTKRLLELRELSAVRCIMSGTAILNSPWDAYSQFAFLDPEILRIRSFTAFKAEYAHLLPPGHGLLRHIAQRTGGRYDPQIVARDAEGNPRWRNLEQLERLIAPHSFRVLKKDCLDLPEKVYTQTYFRMTAAQLKAYERLRDDLRLQLADGRIAPMERIGALTKLSQIVSGYFIVPGTATVQRLMPAADNPKIRALLEVVEDAEGQLIIWARFHAEIEDICAALRAEGVEHVAYHGGVDRAERPEAIRAFESGQARVFVGQQAAGGTGITLVAPNSAAREMAVVYFSNTFSLEDRLQSEDRAHRIGQQKTVRYIDLLAAGTIDERIVSALRMKQDLASTVLGDKRRAAALLE